MDRATKVYYIGLDQSTNNTGLAIGQLDIKTNNLEVYTRLIRPKGITDIRILKTGKIIKDLIKRLEVQKVFLEKVVLWKRNPKIHEVLCGLSYHIRLICLDLKVQQEIISAANNEMQGWPRVLGLSKTDARERFNPTKEISIHEAEALAILYTGLYNDGIIKLDSIPDHRIKG